MDTMVQTDQSQSALSMINQSESALSSTDQSECHGYECATVTRMTEVAQVDEIREKAHRLCGEYLRGAWLLVPSHQLIVRKISGGLSNLLYYCSLPPSCPPTRGEPSCVVLRLYGQTQGEQALQGLIAESVIFTLLSVSQRGPRLYGVIPGGRLEEYIPARPLITEELADPTLSVLIAEKMAQIHMMEVPINKEPRWLWETIDRWMTRIDDFMNQTSIPDEFKPMVQHIITYDLQQERDWLKNYLISIDSRVVFCHNDVQEGNILLRHGTPLSDATDATDAPNAREAKITRDAKDVQVASNAKDASNATDASNVKDASYARDAKDANDVSKDAEDAPDARTNIVLIDFEYCSYNYRAFDIANHMCEWVYDYSNEEHPYFYAKQHNYPTHQQQELFLRHYLATGSKDKNTSSVSDADVQTLKHQVRAFTLASHFFWGLWSVVNASTSTIHFDYWGYGQERFTRYFQHKADLLKSASCDNKL